MMSLVTVFPVITAFHSCCLSHHIFDQVNLWPAWVGFETAIFWQCSPGTVETQRLYPLRHGPRRAIKSYPSRPEVSNPTQAGQRFTWSKTWCDRQQLWKAVITGNMVTRLIIPIRGRGKNHLKKARGEIWLKRSERRNTKKTKKTTKMRTKKFAINKN